MMRKAERKKGYAFEMWCWRRVIRLSWMERKTNICMLKNIKPEWTLESKATQATLSYFGHAAREKRRMEKDVMLREMSMKTKQGRPKIIVKRGTVV